MFLFSMICGRVPHSQQFVSCLLKFFAALDVIEDNVSFSEISCKLLNTKRTKFDVLKRKFCVQPPISNIFQGHES